MNSDKFNAWAEAILDYAHDHYEEDGWDYIYECFSVDDIVDIISWSNSYDEALFIVSTHASIYDERRAEVRAEI